MLLETDGRPIFCLSDGEAESERERLSHYAAYRRLYRNKRLGNFETYLGTRFSKADVRRVMIMINFPGLISRACADLLCGEPAAFVAVNQTGIATPENEYLNRVLQESLFQEEMFQSEISNSYRGDAVFRARICEQRGMIFETIPAYNYYVQGNKHDNRVADVEFIAWLTYSKDVNPYPVIRVQQYGFEQGQQYIAEWAFHAKKTDQGWVRGQQIPLSAVEENPPEEEVTYLEVGVGRLIQHVPNFVDDEQFWGVSDYFDLSPLFEAVNNRISNIDSYLDCHTRPKLIGVTGMADMEGNFNLQTDYIEMMVPDVAKDIPRYLTWEGQMESAFRELEYLEKKIFQISEMSQAIFGIDIATSIDSSMAMRQFFTRTKAKINRKRMIYDQRLKNFMLRALGFAATQESELISEPPSKVDIIWQDGIPRDYTEQVNAESTRYTAGLTTLEESIMRIDGSTKEEAGRQAEQIRKEKAEKMGAPADFTTPTQIN